MDQFSFRISKSENELTLPEGVGELYESEGRSIWVAGELLGGIFKSDVLSKEQLIKSIEGLEDNCSANELIASVVGDAYIIVKSKSLFELYVSMSAPALYYSVDDKGDMYFSNMEKDIYQKSGSLDTLDENEVIAGIVSHQILLRTPFHSLFNNIERLIGGSKLTMDSESINRDIYFLDNISTRNKSWSRKKKEFKFLIENTMKLIKEQSLDEVVLFKSGGIDSAVLLSSFDKKDQLDCYHLPYFGMEDNSVKLAQSIVKDFGQKLYMGEIQNQADLDKLREGGKSGLGTILGPQYLLTHLKLGSGKKLNAISGQNLDTLYYVDTFSPGSINVGLKGFLFALKKLPKRIFFHKSFHDRKWWLRYFPFSVPSSKLNRSFKDFLESLSTPHNEHGILFEKDEFPKELDFIGQSYETTKIDHLFKPYLEILDRKGISDIEEISTEMKMILVKGLRWCRTIHNVPTNYQNLEQSQSIRRIIPFTTGPLATFFLGYQLSMREMFSLKRLCHQYFESQARRSHASYVKSLGVEGVFKLIWRLRILKRETVPVKKDFHKELVILNQLIGNDEDILLNAMKGEEQMKFMRWGYDRLRNNHDFDWDQKMVMLTCRFVNMHILMSEILKNKN